MSERKGFFIFDRNVTVSGFVSLFMDISSEMIYPLVPLFLANVLGVNKSVIGLIEGIAESTAGMLRVFSGWFSDRIGNRKWLMVAGYGISTLSRPLLALAAGWHHVMGFRFIDRFGKGIRTAPRDAIVAESTVKEYLGRAFGFQRAMDTVGAAIGPAIAFLLMGIFSEGYRVVFWLSMVPAAIAVFLIIFFIREGRRPVANQSSIPKLSLSYFNLKFKAFIIIAAIFAAGNSSDVFLILRAQQEGISSATIPVVYLTFNVIYALTSVPAGVAADRFGRKKIILIGFIMFAFIYYGFAIADGPKAIWGLFAFYGIFMGISEGVQKAYLASIISADYKATAFGLYNTAIGLATFPASLIGGMLWDRISPSATFYYGCLTASVSTFLFAIFILHEKTQGIKRA
ncbi:MAG TPA: MFS transporter [Dissulfurispiraceae bacterium]|nr:MFS transporter [Dissulfurispiraceae bacterium]